MDCRDSKPIARLNPEMSAAVRLWTIGHSTLPSEQFLSLLRTHGVRSVADVRRYPASRRHPQFNRDALVESLADAAIGYVHFPELGGRREPLPGSVNTGWPEPGFRGYADYMQTPAFVEAVDALLGQARLQPLAILCAEKDWRNCHRGLIADHLKAAGHQVLHIQPDGSAELHPYTEPARVAAGQLSYRADGSPQASLGF